MSLLGTPAPEGHPNLCSHAWVLGEEFVKSQWVQPDGVLIGLGTVGCICAALQVVIVMMRRNMSTWAHRGLLAVAFADFFSCLWWAVLAPSSTHNDTYVGHDSSCRVIEWARVSIDVSSLIWMFLLCLLVSVDAYNFYSFGIVSRNAMTVFRCLAIGGPPLAIMMIGAWRFTSPCPSAQHDETDLSYFAHCILNIMGITFIVTAFLAVGGVYVTYRRKRGGVWPHRLLTLVVSVFMRGVPSLMQLVGWLGGSCSVHWPQMMSVVCPLLPALHLAAFFCRFDIYAKMQSSVGSKMGTPRTSVSQYSHVTPQLNGSVACGADSGVGESSGPNVTMSRGSRSTSRVNATCTPASHPADGDGSEASSLLNPLREQQAHLDLLWGCTTQVIMFEKKTRGLSFVAPDSDSSSESSDDCRPFFGDGLPGGTPASPASVDY